MLLFTSHATRATINIYIYVAVPTDTIARQGFPDIAAAALSSSRAAAAAAAASLPASPGDPAPRTGAAALLSAPRSWLPPTGEREADPCRAPAPSSRSSRRPRRPCSPLPGVADDPGDAPKSRNTGPMDAKPAGWSASGCKGIHLHRSYLHRRSRNSRGNATGRICGTGPLRSKASAACRGAAAA